MVVWYQCRKRGGTDHAVQIEQRHAPTLAEPAEQRRRVEPEVKEADKEAGACTGTRSGVVEV